MYSSNMAIRDMQGDLGLEWPAENVPALAKEFQKLIDEKVVFWIIEKTGTIRKKTTAHMAASGDDAVKSVKVFIKNEQITRVVNSGLANLVKFEGVADIKPIRKAETGLEAATHDTIAIAAKGGG